MSKDKNTIHPLELAIRNKNNEEAYALIERVEYIFTI